MISKLNYKFCCRYVTYVFNGFKNDLNWNCNATIRYTDPCPGCSKCYQQYQSSGQSDVRWWHVFIPKKITFAQSNQVDYSKVKNDDCDKFKETHVATTELSLVTNNLNNSQSGPPAVKLQVGKLLVNIYY